MKTAVKPNINNWESSGAMCLVDKALSQNHLAFSAGYPRDMAHFLSSTLS